MQLLATLAALGSMASVALGAVQPRQTSSSSSEAALYECHADCGYAIEDATGTSYCSNSTWVDLLDGCLNCALQQDIWQDYSSGVTPLAQACGLNATPVPATSSAAPATAATGTAAAAGIPSSTGVVPSGTAAPSGSVAANPDGTAASPTTTQPVSGASQSWRAGAFVAGAVALLAAGLM